MNKSYFLAPRWGIAPDEVQLGSVLSDFKRPQQALSSTKLLDSIDTDISDPPAEPTSGTAKTSTQWSVGLFAKFMQCITLGGEISYSSSSILEVEYATETMKTRRFTPSSKYIENAAADKNVQDHLKMGGLGAKVFVVTGVKTASDITITTTEEVEDATTVQLGVDVPAIQTTIGPKGSHKKTQLLKQTRTVAGPIVFAFEVEKMRVNRKGKVVSSEYVKGAMLGRTAGVDDDLVIERVAGKPDEEEMEDFEVAIVMGMDEGGEGCDIVVPQQE